MANVGLQIQRDAPGVISPNNAVKFDKTIIDIADFIQYNTLDNSIEITKEGSYYIDWWVSIQSTLSKFISFNIITSTYQAISANTPNLRDEVSGNALIYVKDSDLPYELKLINTSSSDLYYSNDIPVKANLTIIEVGIDTTQPTGSSNLKNLVDGNKSGSVRGIDTEVGYVMGIDSFAIGYKTKASGDVSYAQGYETQALGYISHAEGYKTQAIGELSHAEGEGGFAIGEGSHVEGIDCTAQGLASHAEGEGGFAIGEGSHVEGVDCTAQGFASHAEGNNTFAIGEVSHAQGSDCNALGFASHAEGVESESYGVSSHAEGNNTSAEGESSHAEGDNTVAEGDYSHSEGYLTEAIGGGSHAEGNKTIAEGNYSHSQGEETIAIGVSSHAEGLRCSAEGDYSHVEGIECIAEGESSHAQGYQTRSTNRGSHAEGEDTFSSGVGSHAEGINTQSLFFASHAEGFRTRSTELGSHSEGQFTTASGRASHVEGVSNISDAEASHIEGRGNRSNGQAGCHVMGKFGMAEEPYSWFIGNGQDSVNKQNGAKWLASNGQMYIDGTTYNANGADYGELFETYNNTSIDFGYFVTFDKGKKIRKANENDDYILGITSANSCILGNSAQMNWKDKYIKDEWGNYILEKKVIEDEIDENGYVIKSKTEYYERIINPNWDSTKEYIPRSNREEWVVVGMLGQIIVRDNGKCDIDSYCKVGNEGIAVSAQSGYRVIDRIDENKILIIFK